MTIQDSEVKRAVAMASSSRGSDFAGAITLLGNRVDSLITDFEALRVKVRGIGDSPKGGEVSVDPDRLLGHVPSEES
jgi:hypothetical protein